MPEENKIPRRRVLELTGAAGVAGIAGCTGGESTPTEAPGTPGDGDTATDAMSGRDPDAEFGNNRAYIGAVDVPLVWGMRNYIPDKYGYETGINLFEGIGPVTQSFAAGSIQIGASSLLNPAQMTKAGHDIKMFGLKSGGTDYVHVVNTDLATSFEDFIDSDNIGWGYSGPGGNSHLQPAAVFLDKGMDLNQVNFRAIGGSSTRTNALAGGNLAGASIHWNQWLSIKDQAPVKNLGLSAELLAGWVDAAMYARTSWLDENPNTAIDLCEAGLVGFQNAHDSYDWYYEWYSKYAGEVLPEDETRSTWDSFTGQFGSWPLPPEGPLNLDAVDTYFQTAKHPTVGLLNEDFDHRALFTLDYQDEAISRVNG